MSILSIITIGSTVGEMVINLILAGVLWLVGHYCFQIVTKINAVHEFMISQKEHNGALQRDIVRIDKELKQLDSEIKDQITKLDQKFDRLISEIRKEHQH